MIAIAEISPSRIFITHNGGIICKVHPVRDEGGDIVADATRKRSEHIAEALRHYQQSQEGERVP